MFPIFHEPLNLTRIQVFHLNTEQAAKVGYSKQKIENTIVHNTNLWKLYYMKLNFATYYFHKNWKIRIVIYSRDVIVIREQSIGTSYQYTSNTC